MKRTIVPTSRKRISHENITLQIQEHDGQLNLNVRVEIDSKDYAENTDAEIILEAYNRIDIKRLSLGKIGYYEKEQSHLLPFDVPVRAKINFRLKIIEHNSYRLLGYAEHLKEEKYAKSLLDINTDNENVKNIYKIDFDNPAHPILYLNPELKRIANQLKPVLAEMVFKDILNYLLFQVQEHEDIAQYKWFVFANKFYKYDESQDENNDDYKLDWINQVLCKFTKQNKLVKSLIKVFNAND